MADVLTGNDVVNVVLFRTTHPVLLTWGMAVRYIFAHSGQFQYRVPWLECPRHLLENKHFVRFVINVCSCCEPYPQDED
jgi:hypothetical protein